MREKISIEKSIRDIYSNQKKGRKDIKKHKIHKRTP
jgi:hypothetical protein